MKHCTLYLDGIKDRESLHSRLQGSLMLPSYYGRNLDALKDCLTDVREDTELVVYGWDALSEAMPSYSAALRSVLEDAAAEDPHIKLRFN